MVKVEVKRNFASCELVSNVSYFMFKNSSGTLAFQVGKDYLGVAFSGLRGLSLYPAVSVVMGDAIVGLSYLGRVPVN